MLNQQQIDIIKATAPVVGQHAREITDCFYPLMFERYPRTRALFNQTHQQKGTQRQALANALVAYASHIDELEKLGDAVGLIAHKHCSLNILPADYPIVGECLMEAIGRVLGDALTEDIAAAWAAAYQQLADLLIGVEEEIYQSNSERRGGWRGEREFRIERIVDESAVIKSFYLQPCEGEALIDFLPGQYVGLIVDIEGRSVRRNYSLSDAPGKPGLRISVKLEEGGEVSAFLHRRTSPGDVVRLTPPTGDFVLDPASNASGRPLLFVTGGVGITPAISMLNSCVASGRPVAFVHAAIDGRQHAFADHLKQLSASYSNLRSFVIYERPLPEDRPDASGFIEREMLAEFVPAGADVEVYFLGPTAFMACVNRLTRELGIPRARCHYEFFGPAEALEAAPGA